MICPVCKLVEIEEDMDVCDKCAADIQELREFVNEELSDKISDTNT